MPSLRGLQTLVAVAETGSLTAAAAVLHVSQPALSHQLAALEREVGAPIVDRLARGVRLTHVGEAMLDAARTGTVAAVRAVALGRAVATGESGLLRIACAESMTAGLLAPAFATWCQEYPYVDIELRERTSSDRLMNDLLAGSIDVAIGPRPSRGLGTDHVLGEEELVMICSAEHPFAERVAVTMAEVATQPFVHLAPSNGLAAWLDAVAAAAGVVLRPVIRVRSVLSAAALASAGLGVTLVPRSGWLDTANGAAVSLDPPVARDVVAMHRTPASPLVAAFCATVVRTVPFVVGDS